MQCFLDIDGVLADFVGGACKAHGLESPLDPQPTEKQDWDMANTWGITDTEFWSKFTVEMWTELQPTVEFERVMYSVEGEFNPKNICLLSDPGRDPEVAIAGKLAWIERHMPFYYRNRQYLFGPAKHFCAGSENNLLIDDRDQNVHEFGKNYGRTFLFPRPWNDSFADSTCAVEKLQDYLYSLR